MEVRAISKSVRISPRKIRLVADAIRHLSIDEALRLLQITQKRAGIPLAKTLKSAIANATNNAKLDKNNLIIGSVMINEGLVFKRFRPSTRGRIHPYKKRSSNITIVLKEKIVTAAPVKAIVEKKENSSEEKKGGTKS
jgi:large subunit ribosomal protein L22